MPAGSLRASSTPRKSSTLGFSHRSRKQSQSAMDNGKYEQPGYYPAEEARGRVIPTAQHQHRHHQQIVSPRETVPSAPGRSCGHHEPTSWFHETSSSSSSVEALPIQPATPPRRAPPTSQPMSPASPSSILKYPKYPSASGSGAGQDSNRSTPTLRERGKSVSFSDRTSIYNLPSTDSSATVSANNSQEELWREDVLPKYWRHETVSPTTPTSTSSKQYQQYQQQQPQQQKPGYYYSATAAAAPAPRPSARDSLIDADQQEYGFVRTATNGEYMLPFATPLGIEHIRFSHEELERYNTLRSSLGGNRIPTLVEFLRALRGS